jgi:hypothetical protein
MASTASDVAGCGVEDQTMKLGLLMEAAHAQQTLAASSLEMLKAHVRDLDDIVREEIRRTLVEELEVLGNDSRRAAESLRSLRRAANLRVALWSIGVTTLCSAIPLGEAWWILPSPAEIAALRATRDELASTVAALERHGGRIDLRRCGSGNRLCVRVDRKAPPYGEAADYLVVHGY